MPPRWRHPEDRPFYDAACSARSSYSLYASSTSSRTRFCALVSTIGRSSAKLRRSPLTAYWRAGNVTLRPPAPPRLSHTLNPISVVVPSKIAAPTAGAEGVLIHNPTHTRWQWHAEIEDLKTFITENGWQAARARSADSWK